MKTFNFSINSILAYLGFLFLLGILAFGSTLGVGFMWDDHEMIEDNPKITAINGSNLKHAFTSDVFDGKGDAYYRPIQILSYMIDYRLWGLNPFGFHLTNLLLHIGNAFLLFFLFLKFFKKKRIPFLSAGLFVVHPVVVEQLLIVAGRAEVMSFTFILAGLIVALRGNRQGYILSLVFYLLACFSKESGILFPAFLFLLGWLEPKLKTHWKKYVPYGLIAVFYLLVRHWILPSAGLFPGFKESLLFSLGDLPSVWNEYIRIVLFPVDLHSHRRMNFPFFWQWISPFLVLFVMALGFSLRSKAFWFSLAWFAVGFVPKFPLLVSNALMLDHWAYPSVVGAAFIIGFGLSRGMDKKAPIKQMSSAGFVLVLVVWGGLSLWNVRNRNTDLKMYNWALHFPSSSIVRYNLGLLHYQKGDYGRAETLFNESLQMNPDSPLSANGLALTYWKTDRKEKALDLFDEWINRRPDFIYLYANRAGIVRGRQSLDDLDKAISLKPDYEAAWFLKGAILFEIKDTEEAIKAFKEVVRINPGNVKALSDLGSLHALKGQLETAQDFWSRALVLDPENKIALNNLQWLSRKKYESR